MMEVLTVYERVVAMSVMRSAGTAASCRTIVDVDKAVLVQGASCYLPFRLSIQKRAKTSPSSKNKTTPRADRLRLSRKLDIFLPCEQRRSHLGVSSGMSHFGKTP